MAERFAARTAASEGGFCANRRAGDNSSRTTNMRERDMRIDFRSAMINDYL
jgi:hypothetical protein